MATGLCFVISQIGGDDSIERKMADDLLGLVETCCELHDLDCIRADKIKGSSDINDDIIAHIRTADLCIIDLTNLNPNVMYEFGIRFETRKPFIVLAQKDTKLPFDTITRRTIFYDNLEKASECRRIQKLIREYIDAFEKEDFLNLTLSPSLSNVYSLLEKVNNKLDKVLSTGITSPFLGSASVDMTSVEDILGKLDPTEAFHYAYNTKQIPLAEELLKLLKGNHPENLYFNKLCALANIGSTYAAEELEDSINEIIATESSDTIIEAVGCLVSNYNRRDVEKEKIESMQSVFELALQKMKTNRDRAAILTQKQRLISGAGHIDDAIKIAEEVVNLYDEEPAYWFNYAYLLDKAGELNKAIDQIKRGLSLQTEDDDHLFLSCRILGKCEKADAQVLYKECLAKLNIVNPYKARLLRFQ